MEPPVISLSSPTNNQVFTNGQTVNITGSITDNNIIAELHVHIYNNTTGALLIDIHRTPASGSYNLNETFMVQTGMNYKIQILAKDGAANEAIAVVNVTTN